MNMQHCGSACTEEYPVLEMERITRHQFALPKAPGKVQCLSGQILRPCGRWVYRMCVIITVDEAPQFPRRRHYYAQFYRAGRGYGDVPLPPPVLRLTGSAAKDSRCRAWGSWFLSKHRDGTLNPVRFGLSRGGPSLPV